MTPAPKEEILEHSEIVAEMASDAVRAIAETVANRLPVNVVKAPAPGMVMVKHVDPLEQTPFFMGEAYVTECEVEVAGSLGYGCCLGYDEERALCAAVVDAVMESDNPFRGELLRLLDVEESRVRAAWAREEKAVAATRVNFEVK